MNHSQSPSVRDVFLVILAVLALMFLTAGLGGTGKAVFVLERILIPIPALILLKMKKIPILPACRIRPVPLIFLLPAGLIGLGSAWVMDEANRLIQMLVPMYPELAEAIRNRVHIHSPLEGIAVFLAVVPLAGLGEEILFRGFIQKTLEQYSDITRTVFLTALIFAMVHFMPWWFVQLMILGIFFGVIAWLSDSVFPPAFAHAVYNAWSLILTHAPAEKMAWYQWGAHVSPVWVLAGAGLVYSGFRLFYHFTENRRTR